MKIEKYDGMKICGMHIPYVLLAKHSEKGWEHKDVGVYFKSQEHVLPLKLDEYKKKIISEKEAVAKTSGKSFFDGPMVRLDKIAEEDGRLYLELSKTSFFSFACSNRALGEKLDGRIIREEYVDESQLRGLKDSLANPIGVQLGLITSDNKIILVRRSKNITQYPGLYGVPAGFMEPGKDSGEVTVRNNKYGSFSLREIVSPFFTANRETDEEILGEADKKDSGYNSRLEKICKNMKLLGVGRTYDDLHVEILMSTKTDADSEYIIESSKFAPDKFEFDESTGKPIIAASFNPRNVAQYLVQRVKKRPNGTPEIDGIWIENRSPEWVPAHWMTVYTTLTNSFGKEEVDKELGKALKR